MWVLGGGWRGSGASASPATWRPESERRLQLPGQDARGQGPSGGLDPSGFPGVACLGARISPSVTSRRSGRILSVSACPKRCISPIRGLPSSEGRLAEDLSVTGRGLRKGPNFVPFFMET